MLLTRKYPFTEEKRKELQQKKNLNEAVEFKRRELSEVELDLLKQMLVLNPTNRKAAAELIEHPYFEGWKPSTDPKVKTLVRADAFKQIKQKNEELPPAIKIDVVTGKHRVYLPPRTGGDA